MFAKVSKGSVLRIASALIAICLASSVHAVESWADKKLSVTNGLELWLDASREIAARPQFRSKLMNGGPVDCWHDASGHRRNVYQPVPNAMPHLQQTSPRTAVIHFDGTNDFLSGTGLHSEFEEVTIFIVAAPRSNKEAFTGFLAMNRDGENDYSSGLNVDMGNGSKNKFDFLNVEGVGFVGIQNLMTGSAPFGEPHVLTVSAQVGTNAASFWLDGMAQKTSVAAKRKPRAPRRNRAVAQKVETALACDQLTVGARFFSNDTEPAHVQGFFDGDIAEVLVFSRILSEAERSEVESYLRAKLLSKIAGRAVVPLVAVTNPPPVQMLLPGFTVKELPVSLNNINCVKYREDGKLVALGYDGSIWILTDTDGDGVEDKATAFWKKPTMRAPIGMALTPPGYARGQGVFVPSKSKLSLIVDTNADDIADEEIVVATGWNESFHAVDGLGAAVDKEGNVYFGLGTMNFADAYLVDKETGKSGYDLKNEHGTILKVSPDFKKREIVCTGIRFPVALAFNEANDLFCTDQEGATWLPNGNPFDELLHIETGRHYGFPPRHPKHLPGVIDEPSVFDYAPQHQCTCGLNFNLPAGKGSTATFGPASWRADAFVTGYSRGKLFRTKLVKTEVGYVAQNQLIACLNMMPVDACVSPAGDLVVAVHSGKPDWGSGPTGLGKLYKITYNERAAPQPVLVWPASPTETHVEFDRVLEPADAREFAKKISITQGKYVCAGDEYETIRPGYRAVQNQMLEPRYAVQIVSTALSADGKTFIIRTEPCREAVNYSLAISGGDRPLQGKELPQRSYVSLSHNLTGIEAEWQGSAANEKWSGWLPHLDLEVAKAFTEASATHAPLWAKLRQRGALKIRAQLDLWQMLRAATQPGSELGFVYPEETVTVVLKSKAALSVNAPSMKVERMKGNEVHLTVTPKENKWLPIEVTLSTSSDGASLQVSWFTAEDSRRRAMPLRRIFVPWARPMTGDSQEIERIVPEIAGGNWMHGKKIFFGEQAGCFKCHAIGGNGGKIGPDLSNLIHRDYASVLKDIMEPSAAINPDHIAYNIELKNGEAMTGILVGSTEEHSQVADASGKITSISKKEIASMKPSNLSLMPEGLLQPFTEQQRKDLFTFLLTVAMDPAPLERSGEPPARSRSEIETLLKNAIHPSDETAKPLRIVLCAGPKDHGPGEHDYPFWQKRWSKLLSFSENVTVETADPWPSAGQFSKSDVILFYSNNPGWSPAHAAELDSFLSRGGGAVYLHFAVDGHDHCEDLAQRIGLAWRGGASKFRHGAVDLNFERHPITAGLPQAHFEDESYWNLVGNRTNLQLIASGFEEGMPQPLMWTREQGKGRVFVSIPGHYTWTFDDPVFRLLVLRGMAWTSRQPLGRFDDLVTLGARMRE